MRAKIAKITGPSNPSRVSLSHAVGNIINLNKFRKQKAKTESEKKADTNRRLHGRTKSERAREDLKKRQVDAVVDGAKLDRDGEADD